jgi:hypothetical protein
MTIKTKRKIPSVISLTTLALCAFGASVNAGVVAHYSFDSDFTDGSGNGNNLTSAGGTPTITTLGGETVFGGGALNLDSEENEYLSLATVPAFSPTDAWSVSFWARRTDGSSPGMAMGKAGARNSFIWATDNFDGLRFRPESSTSASNDFTAPKNTGNYHHFVMVADGTGKLTTYVDNGTAQVKAAATGGTSFTIKAIGYAYDDTIYTFGGQLDEVYIFDEAIGAATVSELNANTFVIVPEPSTTALLGLGGLALILRRRK